MISYVQDDDGAVTIDWVVMTSVFVFTGLNGLDSVLASRAGVASGYMSALEQSLLGDGSAQGDDEDDSEDDGSDNDCSSDDSRKT